LAAEENCLRFILLLAMFRAGRALATHERTLRSKASVPFSMSAFYDIGETGLASPVNPTAWAQVEAARRKTTRESPIDAGDDRALAYSEYLNRIATDWMR
jgi:hypothetical protein